MVFNEDSAVFVFIYAEYSEYIPIDATAEGIACIDNIARAAGPKMPVKRQID